jgi:hypothetical protein
MKKLILTLPLVALLTLNLSAGEEKRGEAGFMFLKVPIGARETSLGWTGLTSSSGASALYWNPANASAVDRPTFAFSYLNYFAGISSNYVAVTFPMSDVGTLGASLNYLSYGDIEKTSEASPDGNIGSYNPYEIALGFTYSKQITDRVSGGLTVKFIQSKIDLVSASSVAFDFGFSYSTGYRGIKLGFTASNIGPQAKYEGDGLVREITNVDPTSPLETGFLRYGSEPFELPASVNFGASMDLMRNEENAVTGVVEQNINSFQASRTNFGVEYGFRNMFFARLGYTSSLKRDRDFRTGKSSLGGLTLGTGVDYKFGDNLSANVDYGYTNMGDLLGTVHRFSIGVRF